MQSKVTVQGHLDPAQEKVLQLQTMLYQTATLNEALLGGKCPRFLLLKCMKSVHSIQFYYS